MAFKNKYRSVNPLPTVKKGQERIPNLRNNLIRLSHLFDDKKFMTPCRRECHSSLENLHSQQQERIIKSMEMVWQA